MDEAAPESAEDPAATGPWRLGDRLVARRWGVRWPARCAICNAPEVEPADVDVTWSPPLDGRVLLGGLGLLISFGLRRSTPTALFLCRPHRSEWRRRSLGVQLSAAIVAVLGIALVFAHVWVGILLVLGAGLAAYWLPRQRLRASRMEGDAMILLGVAPAFLALLPEFEASRLEIGPEPEDPLGHVDP